MISVPFQDKLLDITVIQVYTPTTNTKEAEFEHFYEDLRASRTNIKKKKDVLFIIGERNAKAGSQEET